ncbi:MAG: PKD domain-containing protein, partial [Phaeodactylibacter sp.]|nr:PKD domain-containing protein [Phaeodactylibacter sp.]
ANGGGGNDHNSGGGGGGNVNAGGQGGENDNPSFFGCDGRFPGQGGKATNGIPAERIFMGGGGGAGHGNNNVASDGGNGGGIVIIRATEIISNGFVIDANGEAAANAAGDGAGGGGGGGTIVVDLESGSGNMLALRAGGGDGGYANNNNADQCFGPGGGGSGGRILHTAPASMAAVNVLAGEPGLSFNSNACGEGTNNAAPGNDGTALAFEGLSESDEAFAPFQLLAQTGDTSSCAGQPLTLPVTVQGSGLSFQWQVDEGSGFTNLQSGLQYGATDVPALLINTVSNAMDGNQYRLQISGNCIGTVFTEPLTLSVTPGPLAAFAFTIDGLEVSFDNTSSNADSYLWDFGDGANSGQFEPTHTFSGPGIYNVTLTATSSACGQQASFSAQVALQEAPEASFEPMPAAGCAPLSVVFSNTSTGLGNTYQWFFTGGDPASSTDGAPIINYNTPGVYDVTLIASNSAGTSTLVISEAVRVGGPPAVDFSLSADNLSITLTNLSTGADSYLWDFGDGNTSTAANPTHAYSSSGEYEVSLTAANECGSDVLVIAVTIVQQPVPLFSVENAPAGCAPHTVYFVNQSFGDYDSLEWSFPGGMPATSDIPGPEVVYATPGQYDVQLTLFWANGEEALVQPQAVTVLERPAPAFTFTLDGLTATFTNLSANATEYTWNFGDGTTSNEEDPVHTFPGPGNYNVTLNASNQGECTRAVGRTVFIEPSAGAEQPLPEGVKVFPNPTAGQLRLQCENPAWYPVQWRLLGPQGEEIASGETRQDRQWELGGLPAGLYLLQFFNEEGWWTARVVRY